MRIAIVSQNYPPLVNGQATFTRALAFEPPRAAMTCSWPVPAPSLRDTAARAERLQVHRLAGIPLTRRTPQVAIAIRPADRLGQLFDEFVPDVVHVQDHFPLCRSALNEAHRRDCQSWPRTTSCPATSPPTRRSPDVSGPLRSQCCGAPSGTPSGAQTL